jgi:hypothetical protein
MPKSMPRHTRRGVDQRVGHKETKLQVAVCAHASAKLQKTVLGSVSAGPPSGTAEEDGISILCGGEGLVGERGTVGIDGALRLAELGVCMQYVVRTYTTHAMVLEVELANPSRLSRA